jgi:hypothetical protein
MGMSQQRLAPLDEDDGLTPPPPPTYRILAENIDFLMTESGDHLRKEQST